MIFWGLHACVSTLACVHTRQQGLCLGDRPTGSTAAAGRRVRWHAHHLGHHHDHLIGMPHGLTACCSLRLLDTVYQSTQLSADRATRLRRVAPASCWVAWQRLVMGAFPPSPRSPAVPRGYGSIGHREVATAGGSKAKARRRE